jgi:16S rRNA (uracil1498-N3)-methyltransferase
MSRRRFFVPAPRRGQTELSGPEAEHLARVLRVETGQRFELSDNERLYLAEVTTVRKTQVIFDILEDLPAPQPSVTIRLFPALFKFDHFEWLIEKATEMGVTSIHPWEATRTDSGLFQASVKRMTRWQKVALEASQQSRRARLPEIKHAVKRSHALQDDAGIKLFLDEDVFAPPIAANLPAPRGADDHVALLLGPEGGFTDTERSEILAAGWKPCSLGSTILRAETAGIAALAIVQAAWAHS